MLARLAFGNIRRTLRDYAVYAVTLVLGVAVFYAFNTIAAQADFLTGDVRQTLVTVRDILTGITVFLAVIMGFLMVYANSYLLRRRTRELGLYQVLGMRTGQVNAILVIETLSVAALALVIGLAAGMLLSQLMVFVTAALFQTNVSHFHFFLSGYALALTIGCFALMFLVMVCFNSVQLRHVELVDLMGAARRSEKSHMHSLPVSLAFFVLGIVLIVIAYLRLTALGIPGFTSTASDSNNVNFALTTATVIVGTVLFFFGLAGTAAKVLEHIRSFHWRDLRMFTVRQIAARVNTACASMAIISMILFLAITSVTSGMGLVQAMNAQFSSMAPFDASIIGIGYDEETAKAPNLASAMRKAGADPNEIGEHVQVNLRNSGTVKQSVNGDGSRDLSLPAIAKAAERDIPSSLKDYADAQGSTTVVSLSEFNANRELMGLGPLKLGNGHYLALTGSMPDMTSLLEEAMARGHKFTVAGKKLSPASSKAIDDGSQMLQNESSVGLFTLVVPDEVAAKCALAQPTLNFRYAGNAEESEKLITSKAFEKKLEKQLGYSALIYTSAQVKLSSQTTRGLITYLALYIGFVLVIACAAILAIQQLSAASDACPTYRTLSELGCSERLIFGSLRTQTIIAFLLPLVIGIAHSLCALGVILPALAQYGYLSLAGSSALAIVIFALAYGGYLVFTYRTAHNVVKRGLRSARRAI